ncbi:MAG TPA: APC family permease [Gaiellaceae bacterium]|jgi:amino acid transporter
MEQTAATGSGDFDRLRVHSVGLAGTLFQSITHMAPAAAVAYSIYISVGFSGQALALSVAIALVACLLVANSIGQLAKDMPSAGGLYTYVSRTLGPQAGFMVAWCYLLFEPFVAPFLFLEFGWVLNEVFNSELDVSISWAFWVVVITVIIFLLTYRDIRLSTTAGIILGVFEIAVFGALALWMLASNAGDLNLQPFNPDHAQTASSFTGIFKGMVFAVLAFIGFEASAPLGEEARHPRWTIPRAVVLSTLIIGLFYVLMAYSWVFGAGFDNFLTQATGADPWRDLGKIFWSTGWILVLLAILNSIIANSNAGVNAATRVIYAMARNGVAPRALARTHPVFKTPNVAIILNLGMALGISLLLGWVWGPLNAFITIATWIVILVIIVYILTCFGTVAYYLGPRRDQFNPLLHLVFPIAGAFLIGAPLYFQFVPLPAYPYRFGNWIAVGWLVLGVIVTAWLHATRPQSLKNAERIYVEDETIATPAPAPAGR